MVTGALNRKLLRDLAARKGALAALLIIVMIGVGCYVGMAAVYRDLDRARAGYYRDYRIADFTVDMKRAPMSVVDRIAALPGVRAARGRVSLGVRLLLDGDDAPIPGRAISMPLDRRPVIDDVLLRSGVWFSAPDAREVILNEAFARARDLKPGDRIRVLLLDKEHNLLVVGTAMSPEFVYLIPADGGLAPDPARFGVMYLPERFAREACGLAGAWNQVVGLVDDRSRPAMAVTLGRIERLLEPYGVTFTTPWFEQPSVSFLADELQGLKVSAAIMPVLFLGVAALVLNVLLGRMVAQQRTIIGTLKAIGFGTGAIAMHYMAYGLVIGLAGGVAGVALGYWLQTLMVGLYRQFFALPVIEAHLYADVITRAVAISVFFAVLGTLRGVRLAVRLSPAVAMRPPSPERGGRIWIERLEPLWRRLSFGGKMMLRSVFRNPFRSGVSMLASAVATALIVSAFSNSDALDYLMAYTFEKVAHEDVRIQLRDPVGSDIRSEVRELPSISEVEGLLEVVCDVTLGAATKRIGVTGLPPGGRLYTPLGPDGQPILIPGAGIVLSKKLAQILEARPGDRVRLRPLIGRRQTVEAPVVAIVDTFLGLSAYADLDYLSRLLGERSVVNTLLCRTDTHDASEALLRKLDERPAVLGLSQRRNAFTQLEESFGKTMGSMIGIMVLFAGLIAFGSVLNAALVSLSERDREVGTLRVLGFSPGMILRIFAGESCLINGAGIVLGIAFGYGLAHLISAAYSTELYRFPVVIEPRRLLQSALLMALFISLAQGIVYLVIRRFAWLKVVKSSDTG